MAARRYDPFAWLGFAIIIPPIAALRETQRSRSAFDRAAQHLRAAAEGYAQVATELELKHRATEESLARAESAFRLVLELQDEDTIVVGLVRQGVNDLRARLPVLNARRALRAASSAVLREVALALHQLGDHLEAYPMVVIGGAARSTDQPQTGRLPNVALRQLIGWADASGLGTLDLAHLLVGAGIVDDESWEPMNVSKDAAKAIAQWVKRIENARAALN